MDASNINPLLLITQTHVSILVSQSHLHLFTTASTENPSPPTLVPLNIIYLEMIMQVHKI